MRQFQYMMSACVKGVQRLFLSASALHPEQKHDDSQLSVLRARRKAITAHVWDAAIFKRLKSHKILNFSSAADPLYVFMS